MYLKVLILKLAAPQYRNDIVEQRVGEMDASLSFHSRRQKLASHELPPRGQKVLFYL